MATPEVIDNCHYVSNDPHRSKIKLAKFHFDILGRYGVIKESFPGDIGLKKNPLSILKILITWSSIQIFISI